MTVIKDLEGTWREINEALGEAGFAVFPTVPQVSSTTSWPDGDWRRFLAVAGRVQAAIVYCQQLHLDTDEIAHFQEEMFEPRRRLSPLVAPVPEPELDAEELAIVEELEGHQGEPFEITVGFVNGGVLHLWTGEAPWWRSLMDRTAAINDQQADDYTGLMAREQQAVTALLERAKEQKWASKAAEDRRFLAAGSRHARIEALCQVVPELKDLVDGSRGWTSRRVAADLTIEAESLAEQEVKPRLTRLALDDLEALAAEIASDLEWGMARTKQSRSSVVNRFLKAKYGFVMPTVADQLASRKPQI